jgi:hypothetical protein
LPLTQCDGLSIVCTREKIYENASFRHRRWPSASWQRQHRDCSDRRNRPRTRDRYSGVRHETERGVRRAADVTLEIGATLPESVEVHKVDLPDVKYSYVVAGGQTVLVEPETRKIVHIIK